MEEVWQFKPRDLAAARSSRSSIYVGGSDGLEMWECDLRARQAMVSYCSFTQVPLSSKDCQRLVSKFVVIFVSVAETRMSHITSNPN